MLAALLDTSVYISALRQGQAAIIAMRALAGSPLLLSSVVLEELDAGASGHARRVVNRLERDFDRANRILVPTLSDWAHAGQVLSRLAEKYNYEQIGRGRLTNDALIAVSSGRMGITVHTANARDFARLAEFRPFQWQLSSL